MTRAYAAAACLFAASIAGIAATFGPAAVLRIRSHVAHLAGVSGRIVDTESVLRGRVLCHVETFRAHHLVMLWLNMSWHVVHYLPACPH